MYRKYAVWITPQSMMTRFQLQLVSGVIRDILCSEVNRNFIICILLKTKDYFKQSFLIKFTDLTNDNISRHVQETTEGTSSYVFLTVEQVHPAFQISLTQLQGTCTVSQVLSQTKEFSKDRKSIYKLNLPKCSFFRN